MTVKFYGSIGSRVSRCLWVAEEVGMPYDWQSISVLDGSNKTPEYLSINPSGKIPAMTDGDVVMTESLAINMYLGQNYGQDGIWPSSKSDQALVLQWTMWSATEIEYYIGAIFPHLVMKTPEERDQALVDRLLPEMMGKFEALEDILRGKDYILDEFTLADVNVSVQTFTITDRWKLDLDHLPNIRDWTDRCRQRAARRKVDHWAAIGAKAKS